MRRERIETFYEAHRDGLYTYALSLTGCAATAEDAVHTAICKLLSRAVLPRKLKPYAYRCVRNAAVDEWRKHAARSEGDSATEAVSAVSDEGRAGHDIEALLARLAPEARELVLLKALHGFTFREIAATRGASLNTIASQYRRSIQKLKDLCGEA